ncbi:MAG: metallophosphatase family protein [Thermoplasmata archaeon]|nr:metallophosphatase family protein [Thermoplasmata archaeon]
MRIAILADPHSNLPALESVLDRISSLGVSKIILAGDLVGYGPFPTEVIDRAMRLNAVVIRGNHDDAVIKRDYTGMNPFAEYAAKWTASVLCEDDLKYLIDLKESENIGLEDKTIGIYHGSPENAGEYVFDHKRARELLKKTTHEVLICGHTHVPMIESYEHRLFVNPGAVGQPRDRNPNASFAILEIPEMKVDIIRVPYDIELVQNVIREKNLPEFLATRLKLGH